MWNKKYSRANLFQFIQTTFRNNRTNTAYFDLLSGDKLLVTINTIDWMTYSYLIKSSTNIKSKSSDLLLYKTKIRDISWITDFCDNIDLILQKTIIKKQNIIDEIINVDCDFSSNVDFDKFF